MALDEPVQLAEVAAVEGDDCLGLQDAFVLVEMLAGRQGPEEPGKAVYVATVLEDLADAGNLFLGEAE